MPKKKAKAKTGKKVIQKQKQTVIVNVTKRGGGKSKGRPSAPRPQQIPQVIFQQPQQQFPQYERPQERPHTNERERSHVDEILDVVQRANAIYRQQPPPQAITTTNVDVAQILTGGAAVLKTGLDIYRNYSRGQQEQQREQQREERRVDVPRRNQSDIPARPAIPPRPIRPIPVPLRRNPVIPAPVIPAPVIPSPVIPAPERRKTPMELSIEKMLADRDRRNKMTLEAKESGKPLIPFMNFPPRLERKEEKRVELPAPSAPAPAPASAPARPSFHIKNILGQIEFKGAMSSAKQELKYGQEIRRKANEMPPLERVSLGQMGARSILGEQEEKKGGMNSDLIKSASKINRQFIKDRQERRIANRQSSKSSPFARSGSPPTRDLIGVKRQGVPLDNFDTRIKKV